MLATLGAQYGEVLEKGELKLARKGGAFARQHAVCAVTRQPYRVTGGRAPFAIDDVWRAHRLAIPRGEWRGALTGATHEVDGDGLAASQLFAELPVALLARR